MSAPHQSEKTISGQDNLTSMPQTSTLLSIVIVNWNVEDLLRRCLATVYASTGGISGLQVIVIDNASGDGSADMVRSEFPQADLIINNQNIGFTKANNQGISLVKGRYVLLLNPDTEILGNAIPSMIEYLESSPEVGAVGPMLLNSDGSVQSSRRRFPGLRTAIVESTVLQSGFADSNLLKRYYCEDVSPNVEQEVDWLVGACILIRGETLQQIGGLDERFFMYFEELDWCLRAKKAGWKIVYLPLAQVIHHYGQSSGKDVPHRHIFFNDSKCKYFAKHFGSVVGIGLRLFLLGTYLYQMLEESFKYLLGHKKALRRERIGVYFKVLKSGLKA